MSGKRDFSQNKSNPSVKAGIKNKKRHYLESGMHLV